jgi:peptidoglycan/xylan/chitin deacetylase (PgdA/CDA1 family)
MALKHRLFSAGFQAIAATRADRWLRPLAQGAGMILTFHHVRPWRERDFAPNRLLEITPEFLDRTLGMLRHRGFEIVALDEVPARLAAGQGEPPFAALTFDDGYRDNVEHALPVLRRHGAPWTLFVTTEFAQGRGRLWWFELEEAIARLDRVRLPLDGGVVEFPAGSAQEKHAAFDAIYGTLRAGPEDRLRAATALLAEQAGLDPGALCRDLCLTFEEIAALAHEPGVTIGAHTLTHPMLAKHDDATARREIVQGKRVLEERLGIPVRHIAFPVGDRGSAGPREFKLAAEAGFATAVTTRPGHLFPAHLERLHALPRVSVNGLFQTDAALSALLSGVPFLAWNRGRVAALES